MLNEVFKGYKEIKTDDSTGSTLGEKEGLLVLRLFGTPGERGEAHGRLLKEQIHESGINTYYGNFLFDLYMSSDTAGRIPKLFRKPIADALEFWFYAPFEKMLLKDTREELEGIAEAAGIDTREIFRGYAAPDLITHLAVGFLHGGKESLGNFYLGGCSGAFARGSACRPAAGAMLARNMDFPGGHVWKYPAVIYSYPKEDVDMHTLSASGEMKTVRERKRPYVYVSVSGFPGNGLTGINSQGVTMSTFVLFSKNVSKQGLLTLDFNHYLFTRCDSLEAVKQFVKRGDLRTGTPHAVLFADSREAAVVETDAKSCIVREMDSDTDVLVQTNHYINPKMKRRSVEFPLEQEHTKARFRTLTDALEENYGHLNVPRMVDIISCNQYTVSGDIRLFGDFPAQPTTLKSVVFDLGRKKFWVAAGVPPAVCYNRYSGFTFTGNRDVNDAAAKHPGFTRSNRPVFREMSYKPVNTVMKQSLKLVMNSQEQLKTGKLSEAVRSAEQAIKMYRDPGYLYILSLLYLRAGRYSESLATQEELLARHPFGPVKHAALLLWKGRCLDLLGRREEALDVYSRGSSLPGLVPHMKKAFNRGLKRTFHREGIPASFDYFLLGPLHFF